MKKARVKYWEQDTIESGRWQYTEYMDETKALYITDNRLYPRCEIEYLQKESNMETAWLIEASEAQISLFVKTGYLTNTAPAWWTGVNEQIARKNNPGWTQDASEAIRFSRKIDAEKYILGLGYSLENAWLKATEHQWQ
jgi:hypothetical protein